jgi:hypothetical protein
MSAPTLGDLDVYHNKSGSYREHYDFYSVHSRLTQGLCAEVAVSRTESEKIHIRELLIPRYMQGITPSLIHEAVCVYIKDQQKDNAPESPSPTL